MIMAAAVLWIPLIGSLVAGLLSFFNQTTQKDLAKIVTTACVAISTIISLDLAYDVIIKQQIFQGEMLVWIPLQTYTVKWGLYVDMLSAVMCVVVTIVSLMVHIYSLGYMSQEKSIARYMSYLSLFTFFMLFLVLSDDLLQLFLGWEGVGLSSYLLIGFWYKKTTANAASIKAFITNRVGDMAMILGVVGCFVVFNTVSIPSIIAQLPNKSGMLFTFSDAITFQAYVFIAVCFLIGAMAKSAQVGLHVWLPDAMEGPTPVSALIHAATMVTAGVFLLVRLSFLFEYVPQVQLVVIVIGALTALFAALVGLFQSDIKRVIAYSTCSQLGYMFMACGASLYSAALFHLVTHAFFKALLFLSAGSVIHGMSGEQNVWGMGDLYKRMPITYALVWVGSLALSGVPLFAGFYSKDWILGGLYLANTHLTYVVYGVGVFVAFLTAIYSWRLILLVFHGESQAEERVQAHIHEAPLVMLIPKFVLAFGAVFSGMLLFPLFNNESLINAAYMFRPETKHLSFIIHWLPTLVVLVAIALSSYIYLKRRSSLQPLESKALFLRSGFMVDSLYEKVMFNPLNSLARCLMNIGEVVLNQYGPQGVSSLVTKFGEGVRKWQTGWVGDYAVFVIVGCILLLSYIIWVVV